MKVARNEKRKKLLGFSFYINIGNFEAFLWNLNLSAKHLFWRCAYIPDLCCTDPSVTYYEIWTWHCTLCLVKTSIEFYYLTTTICFFKRIVCKKTHIFCSNATFATALLLLSLVNNNKCTEKNNVSHNSQ